MCFIICIIKFKNDLTIILKLSVCILDILDTLTAHTCIIDNNIYTLIIFWKMYIHKCLQQYSIIPPRQKMILYQKVLSKNYYITVGFEIKKKRTIEVLFRVVQYYTFFLKVIFMLC